MPPCAEQDGARPVHTRFHLSLPGAAALVLGAALLTGCGAAGTEQSGGPGEPSPPDSRNPPGHSEPPAVVDCPQNPARPATGTLANGGTFDVLVFTKVGPGSCLQQATAAGVNAIARLGQDHGFSVTATEDAAIFTKEGLASYEVVVFLDTGGDVLNDAQQGALQQFVRETSGGFVGVRGAAGTERDWPWFTDLVGATTIGTPSVQQGTLSKTSAAHPSTAPLPATWELQDQWFAYGNVQGNIVPLLNLSEAGLNTTPAMGAYHPVSWYQYYDGGRSWYTGLGHDPAQYADESFSAHLLGGIRWAANKANKPPATLTWAGAAAAPQKPGSLRPGRWEAAAVATEGKLFTFGGYVNGAESDVQATTDTYAYDIVRNSWSAPLAPMPLAVTHAGQALDGRTVWIAGGFVGNSEATITTDKVWKYDIAADRWDTGPPLPEPRGGGALVRLGRQLHFFGGTQREGQVYHVDRGEHWVLNLDAAQPRWESRAPYPSPVNHMAGAALHGKVYGIGGQDTGNENHGNVALVYAYDPQVDRWTAVKSMPRPLGHTVASTFTRGGRIVVVGGTTNRPPASTEPGGLDVANVTEYDPVANEWTELTPIPHPRQSPVAGITGGVMVVSTGEYQEQPRADTWLSAP